METLQVSNSKLTKRPRKAKDLGPLHDLLKRGLPSYVDENGILDVRALAAEMMVSYQAVYLMFSRGSISKQRIATVCHLSASTKPSKRPKTMLVKGEEVPWAPLVLDDFWPFMGNAGKTVA